MLTHGAILGINMEKATLATGMEHVGALGWHLFPQTTMNFPKCKMRPAFEQCTIDELKLLAGRGIHIPSLSQWMFYILANCMRHKDQEVKRPLCSFDDEAEIEEALLSQASGADS